MSCLPNESPITRIELSACNVYGGNSIRDPNMCDRSQTDLLINVQRLEKCEQTFEHRGRKRTQRCRKMSVFVDSVLFKAAILCKFSGS